MMKLFSSEIIQEKREENIFHNTYLMKLSGVNISEYLIENSFYRLNEGNLKGAFLWNKTGTEYQTQYEIPFINENGSWKLNTLPILRN